MNMHGPAPRTGPPSLDWGIGRYEQTATQLQPAADVLVREASPTAGERVVDIGCGTGNAALLLARRGATVTGVDPAARLLEVAADRANAEDLDVRFVSGVASALPIDDRSVDLALSVFGLIFDPDPMAVAAELSRVTTPSGRVHFTAWLPGSGIERMNAAAQEAVGRALGAPPAAPGFPWHDQADLSTLLSPHGFTCTLTEHSLAFQASSPRAFLENESSTHPLAVAGIQILTQLGLADQTRAQLLDILEEANEDPDGFRSTSRYVTVAARRHGG